MLISSNIQKINIWLINLINTNFSSIHWEKYQFKKNVILLDTWIFLIRKRDIL